MSPNGHLLSPALMANMQKGVIISAKVVKFFFSSFHLYLSIDAWSAQRAYGMYYFLKDTFQLTLERSVK